LAHSEASGDKNVKPPREKRKETSVNEAPFLTMNIKLVDDNILLF
jgi:hypothetical protein